MSGPISAGPTVIVGAGLAGLVAATELQAAGRQVIVIEAGRGVGGRLATRDTVTGATFDHGAQFFTVRSADFDAFVRPLLREGAPGGLVYEWCQGFDIVDGYPRYAVRGGMNALARHLAVGLGAVGSRAVGSRAVGSSTVGSSTVVDVRLGVTVRSVAPIPGGGWLLQSDTEPIEAAAVVLTPPLPAALALLHAGGTPVDAELASVAYNRVLAVLVELDGASAVPEPGGVQLTEGAFSFVADNRRKGISGRSAVTLHASHQRSAALWDGADADVLAALLGEASPWLGRVPIVAAKLQRWRFAGPVSPWPAACHDVGGGLVLAGDGFAGSKVEGAFLSGRAAAAALLGA